MYHPWYYPEVRGWRSRFDQVRAALGLADPLLFPGPRLQSEGYRMEELVCDDLVLT
jgi:hypothetical protein